MFFSTLASGQAANSETSNSQDLRFTLSGIDGTGIFQETVCPGFNMCFDIFAFGGNQTQKADMFWDAGIPGAAFIVNNEDMPSGHFCWTPSVTDARTTPYVFHVTLKTAAGEKSFAYTISVPLLRAEIKTTDVTCFGNSDGTASAIVTGGSGSYIYQWSNHGETKSSIEGLGEGNYTLEVMDDFGCETAASARIYSPQPLLLEALSKHTTCLINGGEAEVIASGGTMPYTYSWLPGEAATDRLDNLPSGVYTAVVTDANGCTAYRQVNISAALPAEDAEERKEMIASEAPMTNVLIYPNPTRGSFTVRNISDATVTVSVVNCIGQTVYNTINIPANLSASIPMEEQGTGIFLVKVQQHANIEMVKLIKE